MLVNVLVANSWRRLLIGNIGTLKIGALNIGTRRQFLASPIDWKLI